MACIAILKPNSNPEHEFAAEILKAEGLFDFEALPAESFSPSRLKEAQVTLALRGEYSPSHAEMLTDYLRKGGRLRKAIVISLAAGQQAEVAIVC